MQPKTGNFYVCKEYGLSAPIRRGLSLSCLQGIPVPRLRMGYSSALFFYIYTRLWELKAIIPKLLAEQIKFTKEQVQEMYRILMEIHDALLDKRNNKKENRLNLYEIGWLISIDELLIEIDKTR